MEQIVYDLITAIMLIIWVWIAFHIWSVYVNNAKHTLEQ